MRRKIMTALLLLFGVTALIANASVLQNGGKNKRTPEQRATQYADSLAIKLGLSADQKAKVYAFALTRAMKMDELRKTYKGQDKKVWKTDRKQVRDNFMAGMKATLTPEQYAQWLDLRKQRAAEKGKGKKGKATADDPSEGDVDSDLDGE